MTPIAVHTGAALPYQPSTTIAQDQRTHTVEPKGRRHVYCRSLVRFVNRAGSGSAQSVRRSCSPSIVPGVQAVRRCPDHRMGAQQNQLARLQKWYHRDATDQ
jgi:hypothetical protein